MDEMELLETKLKYTLSFTVSYSTPERVVHVNYKRKRLDTNPLGVWPVSVSLPAGRGQDHPKTQ